MTRPAQSLGNPNYRQVLRGYLRLHQLTVEGRDETQDADAVRDSLDLPWRALTEDEKERVQGLSDDLFSISEPIAAGPYEMNAQAQNDLANAFESIQRGEWDRALGLLRRGRQFITPALLSYLRGRIWLEAGYPEVGVVFLDHAKQSEPGNVNYAVLFLHSLERFNPQRAWKEANEILQSPDRYPALLVVWAAIVAVGATQTMTESDAATLYRFLIPILTKALRNISDTEKRSVYLMGLALLALSHEYLGEMGDALQCYSRGLGIDPSHEALLIGRGVLTYGKSPQSPNDLEQAVKLGSQLVWPYFFLAHHYAVNNRYDDCRRMCERGLEMKASPAVLSQVSEWLAIAKAELGFPPEIVRAAFEQALRLDPSNEMARRNLQAFEQALSHPAAPKEWEKRSENTVRVFGQAERRNPLAA
jgi:tetratricopeptide (TPR) repeat protein